MTDHLQSGYITLEFTLATEPCVDRINQLLLSFRGTGRPVCQAVDAAHTAICASRLPTSRRSVDGNFDDFGSKTKSKMACERDSKCRYRIPCNGDDLDLQELVSVQKKYQQHAPHTVYTITIQTNKLSTKGAEAGIYTAPHTSASVAKIEVCIRPSVTVSGVEVLFREVVAAVNMEMTGRVKLDRAKLDIESDSDASDNASPDNMDASMQKEITTDAFACQRTEHSMGVMYEKISPLPQGPSSTVMLCVTGASSAIHCTDISDVGINAHQLAGRNIVTNIPTSAVTRKIIGASVLKDNEEAKGCVLALDLGGWHDQSLSSTRVKISGKAHMLSVPEGEANNVIKEPAMAVVDQSAPERRVLDFSLELTFVSNMYAVSGGMTSHWAGPTGFCTIVLMTVLMMGL